AVPLADHSAGRPQVTLRIPADQELGERDGDDLPFAVACCLYDQTELHGMTSFLMVKHPSARRGATEQAVSVSHAHVQGSLRTTRHSLPFPGDAPGVSQPVMQSR